MKTWPTRLIVAFFLSIVAIGPPPAAFAQAPIKIGLVQGFTGPLEVYAKQARRGFELGLDYATGGKNELARAQDRDHRGGRPAQAGRGQAEGHQALRRREGRPRGGNHLERGGARDPAGGRGVQEGPDRGAGGGGQHHRRELEPLRLRTGPQLRARTPSPTPSRSPSPACRSPHRPGLRVRPRRGRRLQGGGREGGGQGRARGVHAAPATDFTAPIPEDHRGAQGQGGPQGTCS